MTTSARDKHQSFTEPPIPSLQKCAHWRPFIPHLLTTNLIDICSPTRPKHSKKWGILISCMPMISWKQSIDSISQPHSMVNLLNKKCCLRVSLSKGRFWKYWCSCLPLCSTFSIRVSFIAIFVLRIFSKIRIKLFWVTSAGVVSFKPIP